VSQAHITTHQPPDIAGATNQTGKHHTANHAEFVIVVSLYLDNEWSPTQT